MHSIHTIYTICILYTIYTINYIYQIPHTIYINIRCNLPITYTEIHWRPQDILEGVYCYVKFLVSDKFLMKGFCCGFFYTMHSMTGLGKEAQSQFVIQYSLYKHVLILCWGLTVDIELRKRIVCILLHQVTSGLVSAASQLETT